MTLQQAIEAIKAEAIVPATSGTVRVNGGFAADLMSDVLAFADTGALLITGLPSDQTVRTAAIKHLTAVVVVEGKTVGGDVVETAQEEGVPIYSTPLSKYEACGLLVQAGLRPCRRGAWRPPAGEEL